MSKGVKKYNNPEWVGKKFNMLTVIEIIHDDIAKGWRWRVRCDCGNEKIYQPNKVVRGLNVSCGCYRKTRLGPNPPTHRESHTRLHNIWCGMNSRCDPSHVDAERYGKRGIRVCEEWHDYTKFAEWARSHGYEDGLTIERIDVNGNYEPSNCKWIPISKQARNRTTTRWVEYQGETMSLAEAAERAGLKYKEVHYRIHKLGWTLEDALSIPIREGLSDLHKECIERGADYHTVYNRVVIRGWDKERAFTEPKHPRRTQAEMAAERAKQQAATIR